MRLREKDVMIQSKVTLRGTISFPEVVNEKNPAVLIIPGTGKLDRNGKINKKLDLKLYRQISEFLSSIGFINVRYDKRGVGESEGDFLETGLWDLVDDAQAAVQFLKALPEVDPDKVIILGHSEGATIGTAVAAREQIGGLILLAGAIERISEALKRQRDLATKDILNAKGFQGFLLRLLGTQNKVEKQAQKYTNKVLQSKKDVMRVGFIKTNAKWIREHFAYNVREDLVRVTCPILAITGSRDIQADPEILKDLPKHVKGDAHYHVVDNMSHSLKFQAAASTMFSAKKDIVASGELPIHPELINLLEKWLEDRYESNEEPVVI
jgi:uncharacterized protein